MRTIKFSYIFQHEDTGRYTEKIFDYLGLYLGYVKNYLDTNMIRCIVVAKRQFTGLTDKNGKEIYEGDIVEWGMDGEEITIRRAVVNIDPDIQFQRFNDVDYAFQFGSFAYQDTENHLVVIGNIYENPELLNKTA